MNWDRLSMSLSAVLGAIVLWRLWALQLQKEYKVFCLWIVSQIAEALIVLVNFLGGESVDYRPLWAGITLVDAALSLWVIHALLKAILERLPGVLRLSRKFLNVIFVVAAVVAIGTAKPALMTVNAGAVLSDAGEWVDVAKILDRVMCTVGVIVLLAVLSFVLWFPVRMPKNPVILGCGMIVYFSVQTALLLLSGAFTERQNSSFGTLIVFAECACFVYWSLFITRRGESAELTLGRGWRDSEHDRLLQELNALNSSLIRGIRQ